MFDNDEETQSTMPEEGETTESSTVDIEEGKTEANNNNEVGSESSAGTQNTDADDGTTLTPEEQEAKDAQDVIDAAAVKEQADKDFSKHPRFQELIQQAKASKVELARLTALVGQANARDFAAENTALEEKLNEGDIDVPEYNKALRQLVQEEADVKVAAQDAERETTRLNTESETQFLTENPHIDTILKDKDRENEIAVLLDSNPVHDKVTAAMTLHIQDLETGQKEAIDKAVAAAQETWTKNQAAKRGAQSLGQGNGKVIDGKDAVIQTDGTKNGLISGFAEKLKLSRKQ
jgi:hypothetical protein